MPTEIDFVPLGDAPAPDAQAQPIDFVPIGAALHPREPDPKSQPFEPAIWQGPLPPDPGPDWDTLGPGEPPGGSITQAYRAIRDAPLVESVLGRRDQLPLRGDMASHIDRYGLIPGLFAPSEKINTRSMRVGPQDTPIKQLAGGAYNATLGTVDTLMSPGGVLTGMFGSALAVPGAATTIAPSVLKLLSGAFGIDMAKGAIEQVPEAKKAYDKGDLQTAAEIATSSLLSAGMAGLAAKHAVTRTPPAAPIPFADEMAAPPVIPREAAAPPGPGPSGRDITADQLEYERKLKAFQQGLGPAPGQEAGAPHFVESQDTVQASAEVPRQPQVAPPPAVEPAPVVAQPLVPDVVAPAPGARTEPDKIDFVPIDKGEPVAGAAESDGVASPKEDVTTAPTVTTGAAAEPSTSTTTEAVPAPAAEGEVQALPPGTTPVTGTTMPVAMNPVGPERSLVSIPQIFEQFGKVIKTVGGNTPIRWGRMGPYARVALGFYRPFQEVIRLRTADDITTAVHEVAHHLDKRLFNRPGVPLHRTAPPPVRSELMALGRALYGSRRPTAGYVSEGFSELARYWVTRDDLSTVAPRAKAWFESAVLGTRPQLASEMYKARRMVDAWREQGASGRAAAQMGPRDTILGKATKALRDEHGVRGLIEEATPLELISKTYRDIRGHRMPTEKDPFALYTARRGIAPKVLQTMVNDGMIDIHGRRTGAPALKDGLKTIKPGDAKDFANYLWARRAIERHSVGKNPGLSKEDATHLRDQLQTRPGFQAAAVAYHKWWDGLLQYYSESSPTAREAVARIRAGSKDYVPLPRVLPEELARVGAAARTGGGLHKMKGSGMQIKDIYESTYKVAEKLIRTSHDEAWKNAVFNAARNEGMGWLVEKVDRPQVGVDVTLGKLRKQLEDAGMDTSTVPDDKLLLTFYQFAEKPTGFESIIPRKGPGGQLEWYQINPEIARLMEGAPEDVASKMPMIADWALRTTNKTFKLGTTALRPGFALFNSMRDVQNLFLQSHFSANPAKILKAYMGAWAETVRGGFSEIGLGKTPKTLEMLHDLAVPMANMHAGDIGSVKREVKGLFHGKLFRRVTSPVETLRDLIGTAENVPRLAELKLGLQHFGWKPGDPITPEAALQLRIATKRVTTDFTARGGSATYSWLQKYAPFFGAQVQGMRAAARTLKGDRLVGPERSKARIAAQMAMWGGTMMAFNLANWYRNKDEEWYQHLPRREKELYMNVKGPNGIVWQIARPQEWGTMFETIPEMLANMAYAKDPGTAKDLMGFVSDMVIPNVVPVPAKAIYEQGFNKSFFFDRPIVPNNQLRLAPGEQQGPYTSKVAKWIGEAFPDSVSPRRVDFAMRQFAGGALPDFLTAVGLGPDKVSREPEWSDVFAIGRLFRRGGQFSANTQPLQDFFERYAHLEQRARSKGRPMTPTEESEWEMLREGRENIVFALDIANRAHDQAPRQSLYRSASTQAQTYNQISRNLQKQGK